MSYLMSGIISGCKSKSSIMSIEIHFRKMFFRALCFAIFQYYISSFQTILFFLLNFSPEKNSFGKTIFTTHEQ